MRIAAFEIKKKRQQGEKKKHLVSVGYGKGECNFLDLMELLYIPGKNRNFQTKEVFMIRNTSLFLSQLKIECKVKIYLVVELIRQKRKEKTNTEKEIDNKKKVIIFSPFIDAILNGIH